MSENAKSLIIIVLDKFLHQNKVFERVILHQNKIFQWVILHQNKIFEIFRADKAHLLQAIFRISKIIFTMSEIFFPFL